MRVAVLTNAYPPVHQGGAAQIAERQVEMLKQADHEVRVWSPDCSWLQDGAWSRLKHHLKDLKAQEQTVNEMLAWKPDVLLTHNLTGCGFGTPRAIQAHKIQWIHVLHDVQLFEPSGQLQDERTITPWQIFWGVMRVTYLGNPEIVISPTEWLLKQHERRGVINRKKSQAIVLPNPGPIIKHVDRHVPHTPIRLLFVGHISKEKGSDVLIKLGQKLSSAYELWIVGDGPDRERIKQVGAQVRYFGALASDQVLEKMKQADILLVPSQIVENQPTVILEAASVGLPLIASNLGGIMETLGESTWCVTFYDVSAWVESIERLTKDPVGYRQQSERMYEIAKQHDPEEYQKKILGLLRSNS
ncbi:glycosyltransferase [Candidatus Uhrbacteria bacterium]|nr:glycosyltransferase [Candidatus Uhrbacteria bacterium]